jgi:hypothetical protein
VCTPRAKPASTLAGPKAHSRRHRRITNRTETPPGRHKPSCGAESLSSRGLPHAPSVNAGGAVPGFHAQIRCTVLLPSAALHPHIRGRQATSQRSVPGFDSTMGRYAVCIWRPAHAFPRAGRRQCSTLRPVAQDLECSTLHAQLQYQDQDGEGANAEFHVRGIKIELGTNFFRVRSINVSLS